MSTGCMEQAERYEAGVKKKLWPGTRWRRNSGRQKSRDPTHERRRGATSRRPNISRSPSASRNRTRRSPPTTRARVRWPRARHASATKTSIRRSSGRARASACRRSRRGSCWRRARSRSAMRSSSGAARTGRTGPTSLSRRRRSTSRRKSTPRRSSTTWSGARRSRPIRLTCSPTSTASTTPRRAPSSTSTTSTGRTASSSATRSP